MTGAYDVTLDAQGYLIDAATYRKSVASPFAPKQRQGDPGYGDLTQFSVWALTDWRGGQGYASFDPAHPDRYDAGIVDVSQGDIRLGPALTSVYNPGSSSTTDICAFCTFEGVLYAVSADSADILSSSDGSTWSVAHTPTGYTSIRSLCVFNGYLHFGSGTSGKIGRFDGSSWTDTWITIGGAAAVRSLVAWNPAGTEFLYAGCTLSTSGHAIISRIPAGGAATTVFEHQYGTLDAMIVWGAQLIVCVYSETAGYRGTLYSYDGALFSVLAELHDNAITSFCLFRDPATPLPATSLASTGSPSPGQLRPPEPVDPALLQAVGAGRPPLLAGSRTGGIVWAVGATGLIELVHFPGIIGVGIGPAAIYSYGFAIRSMALAQGRLWVPVVTTDGLGLYAYDGHGWSNPSGGADGQEPRAIAAFNSTLVVSNKSNAGAEIFVTDTTVLDSASIYFASFDAGLAATEKLLLSVTLQHSALASGESIQVEYALDDSGSYTSLGTSATDDATTATLSFPTGTVARRVKLRVTLAVSDTSATPALQALLLTYVVATDSKAEWTFDVLLEGTAEAPLVLLDQSAETSTGAELSAALWASKAKKETLAFTDLNGDSKTVLLVDVTEQVSQRSQRLGPGTRARVKLVEA